MTNSVNSILGICVAFGTAGVVSTPVDAIATLSGVALMVWLTCKKSTECEKLRTENHSLRQEHQQMREELKKLSRELGKRCSDCKLAMAANSEFIESHIEHENKNKIDTEKAGR